MKIFHFKQFSIHLTDNVMPLTADAVLFGAWASSSKGQRILDIGCGSGILSLILAQRNPEAHITGIDISNKAVEISMKNVSGSPFSSRIDIRQQDLSNFQTQTLFDTIVVNPPFFSSGEHRKNLHIANSRHDRTFRKAKLLERAFALTSDTGRLCLLSPIEDELYWIHLAGSAGWRLMRKTYMGKSHERVKRIAFEWNKFISNSAESVTEYIILDPSCDRYNDYYDLVNDLYLRVKK